MEVPWPMDRTVDGGEGQPGSELGPGGSCGVHSCGLLPLLIADFSLVSFVGFICSSLSFLDLVVALCICIVHFCIVHCLTCTSILVYIAMIV